MNTALTLHLVQHVRIKMKLNPTDIVIPKPQICVAVGYPVRQEYLFILRADKARKGFTRREIALKFPHLYEDIIEVGSRTAPDPGKAGPLSYNRGVSDGQYGIRIMI